jgi:hypothetical protein
MYDQIQQIAIKDGARTHHISQKVEVSPTVIKLVQLGLDALNGKLPDTSGDISDSLSDKSLSTVSDKNNEISDISDKRIETIVDRRLAELGLFPDRQTDDTSTSDTVPDNLSDKDVIISDKGALLPDSLSDTENIPSDDSSNSESILDVVQIIPSDEIEQFSGEISASYSYSEFHDWLGLARTARNKVNGDTAIDFARSQGHGEWVMSKSYKFTIKSDNN